jgi:hypothetical protein
MWVTESGKFTIAGGISLRPQLPKSKKSGCSLMAFSINLLAWSFIFSFLLITNMSNRRIFFSMIDVSSKGAIVEVLWMNMAE